MNPLNQQLLLVKYLYQQGDDALREKGMFSAGLAISLFQDSVESLLWTIAKEVDADIRDRDGFEGYWDAVKLGKKNPSRKELPPKTKMRDLNKARVVFKHNGIVPADGEAMRLQTYTEQFLIDACQEFFGVDFARLSLVDLVRHPFVSNHLRAAEEATRLGDALGAIDECAKANYCLTYLLDSVLPADVLGFGSLVVKSTEDWTNIDANQARRIADESVRGLKNCLLATSVGVSLGEYVRFRNLMPTAVLTHSGDVEIVRTANEGNPNSTLEDAFFATNHLTKFALSVQKALDAIKAGEFS